MGFAAELPRVLKGRDLAKLPQMTIIMRRFPVEKNHECTHSGLKTTGPNGPSTWAHNSLGRQVCL
jgi:hypothetical protein